MFASVRQGLQIVAQKIGLVGDALQVGVLLPIVVGNRIGLEELRVFDQQFDGRGASLRGLDGGMQHLRRELAAVDGDQPHTWTKARLVRRRADADVAQLAICGHGKSQRIAEVGGLRQLLHGTIE